LLTTGTQIEKLIVLHPNLDPIKAQLLYESYNGWIYSGRPHWRVDKVIMSDGFGKKVENQIPKISVDLLFQAISLAYRKV